MKAIGLRHLRVLLAIADTASVTRAAFDCAVSQSAASQALSKIQEAANGPLFVRSTDGMIATERGKVLLRRARRAVERLDAALTEISPRLVLTATSAQLNALIAVVEFQNFTIAARRLGLAQPTVHRAVAALEDQAGRALFDRTPHHLVPTTAARQLDLSSRLAFAEMSQAASDLAEIDGRSTGNIVVGGLPLSRSAILPQALVRFREVWKEQQVTVMDGTYDELLGSLRRGQIDFIIGAMRDPEPVGDVVQETLFKDSMLVVSGAQHPLADRRSVTIADLAGYPWVVARDGTPSRTQFDDHIGQRLQSLSIVETGSVLLMRGLLNDQKHLGCVSAGQAEPEIAAGLMIPLSLKLAWPGRPIGFTTRRDWLPTKAQSELIGLCRNVAGKV